MKIGGVIVNGPAQEILVLPRGTSEDIVFTCQAVLDMKPFNAMCPEPKPGKIMMAGSKKFQPNKEDPGYIEQCLQHSSLRFSYISLKSLEPSNIEWEKVDMNQPSTWSHWEQELLDAGMSSIEVNRVVITIMRANSLDEEMLQKARESFLRGMEEEKVESSGPSTEPDSTQSGEPANDSE